MFELHAEDYPFGWRKIDEYETEPAAVAAMLSRYDAGLDGGDYLVKETGGFPVRYKEHQLCIVDCPICRKQVRAYAMMMTRDYHGVPMRKVCQKCWMDIQFDPGYDGVKYGAESEYLDYDY